MRNLLFLAIVLSVNILICSTDGKFSTKIDNIEKLLSRVMDCWSVPGLSLVVVQNGETLVKRAYGLADIEKSIAVTDDTIFSLASMSKQMSVSLLAILLEEHGIPWRTKVKDVIPGFEMPTNYMTEHTTIEDIVSHRTGVRTRMNDGTFTREQAYERIKYVRPTNNFREELLYTGTIFSVVAKLSETLGGKSWEQLMRDRLFEPLGMTSATFYDTTIIGNDSFAKPYMKDRGGPLTYIDQAAAATVGAVGPAGSIMASTNDMEKYVKFLVDGGKDADGTALLSKSALEEAYSPLMVLPQPWLNGYMQLPVGDHLRTLDSYAHGWMLGYYRENKVIYHYGGLYGYNGLISQFPETSSAIYTAVNGPGHRGAYMAMDLIQDYVADVILGLNPWLNGDNVCTYPAPWMRGSSEDFMGDNSPPEVVDKSIMPSRPIWSYVGKYGNFAYGNLTIFVNDTDSFLQLDYGPLEKFKLYPTKESDRFSVEVFGHLTFLERDLSSKYNTMAAVFFEADDGDDVTTVSLDIDGEGPPIVFRRGLKLADAANYPKKSDCN